MISIKKNLFITASLLICFVNNSTSQSVSPPVNMEVYMTIAPGDTTNNWGDTLFQSSTHLKATMVVVLEDTNNVQNMLVKLGTSDGASDLIEKSFSFTNTGTFNDGTSYSRNGKIVTLGLGDFIGVNVYYAEIKLQAFSGNFSSSVKYNNL